MNYGRKISAGFLVLVLVICLTSITGRSEDADCVAQTQHKALMDKLRDELEASKNQVKANEDIAKSLQATLQADIEKLGKEKATCVEASEVLFGNMKKHEENLRTTDAALAECSKKVESLSAHATELEGCRQDVSSLTSIKDMLSQCESSLTTRGAELKSVERAMQVKEDLLRDELEVLQKDIAKSIKEREAALEEVSSSTKTLKETKAALQKAEEQLKAIAPSNLLFSTEQLKRNLRKVVAVNAAVAKFVYAKAAAAIPKSAIEDLHKYRDQARAELRALYSQVEPFVAHGVEVVVEKSQAARQLFSKEVRPRVEAIWKNHALADQMRNQWEMLKRVSTEKLEAANDWVDNAIVEPLSAAHPEIAQHIPKSGVDRLLAVAYTLLILYISCIAGRILLSYTLCPAIKISKKIVFFPFWLLKEILLLPFRLIWFSFASVFSCSSSKASAKDVKQEEKTRKNPSRKDNGSKKDSEARDKKSPSKTPSKKP